MMTLTHSVFSKNSGLSAMVAVEHLQEWDTATRSIHVTLRHVTQYQYDRAVELSPQLVRLRPAPHCRTPILSYSQRITPSDHFLNWQQDPQSNYVARVTFPDKVEELRVEIDLVAEMAVYNPFDFFLEPSAEHFPFSYDTSELRDLQPFLHKAPLTQRLGCYVGGIDRRPRRTTTWSTSTANCSRTFRTSSGSTPASRTSNGRSSCHRAHAATPRGCSCRSSGTWDSPHVSCPAI